MSFMAEGYGPPIRFRKAFIAGGLAILLALPCLAARAEPVRLLILGDSLTAGYGLARADGFQARLAAALAAKGVAVRILDGAVSADTTAGGLSRLDWALDGGADAAIVELGANDGLRGADPAAMEANLAAILDALAAKRVRVLLTGMRAPPNMGQDYEAAYTAAFAQLGRRADVLYDPFFLAGVAGDPKLNQPDGIHPSAAGVELIVARMLPLVERLIADAQAGADGGRE